MHTTPSVPPRPSIATTSRLVATAFALSVIGLGVFFLAKRSAAPRTEPPRLVPRAGHESVADAGDVPPETREPAVSEPTLAGRRTHWAGEPQAGDQIHVRLRDDEAPREPRVRFRVTQVQGPITEKAVRRVLHERLSTLESCYAAAVAERPELTDRWAFTLEVDVTGLARTTSIESLEARDPALETCTRAAIARWRFPSARGATARTVTFAALFGN